LVYVRFRKSAIGRVIGDNTGGVNRRMVFRVWASAKIAPGLNGRREPDEITRIKMQKVAFIAQEVLGIPLGVEFDRFLYGPYSAVLAELYYDGLLMLRLKSAVPLDGFEGCVLREIGGWSWKDLEVLSTLYYFTRRYDFDDAVRATTAVKPISENEVREVYRRFISAVIECRRKCGDPVY